MHFASAVAQPSGAPDEVASMIMHKPIYPDAVDAVAFSPDGRVLASGDGHGRLRLWDVAAGRLRQEVQAHSNDVHAVAMTRDGKRLISAGDDRQLVFWDLAGGKPVLHFQARDQQIPRWR